MRRCAECGCWEYGGAPGCVRCAALVDRIVEDGWRGFLRERFGTAGPPGGSGASAGRAGAGSSAKRGEAGLSAGLGAAGLSAEEESVIAEMVADEPDRHDWRVVDGALDRLICPDCGARRGRGPLGCPPCDLADGFRYSAIETDRPGVPPGNEHAIRVGVSVIRAGHRQSPRALLGWRLGLPALLDGFLPTTAQAQAMRARINAGATYDDLAGMWNSSDTSGAEAAGFGRGEDVKGR
ncbi:MULTISPECIES: hypothetical protein [unclassified Streptosporangium]|uniref:hypothetical protein n=1 Tax=unclassified Streptosporangium TaxID=2632669 RepID=UPI002E27D8EA|nr:MULTISPECIES: hypothetical protein [unclassified Streptosporangium]